MGSNQNSQGSIYGRVFTLAAGGTIVAVGIVAMLALGHQGANADAPRDLNGEQSIPVEYIEASYSDVPVTIIGHGEARALRRIVLAPEVSGVVLETHPNLVTGGQIATGDVLLVIDPESYVIAVEDAAAALSRRAAEIDRLTEEWRNDEERLSILERQAELAKRQFDRLDSLLDEDVGTADAMELAEQAYLNVQDNADQLLRRIALYPTRLREGLNDVASAQARLDAAQLQLSKTQIRASFDARVASYSVETGQFVQMGEPVAELVDDSVLEISAPLDSREARRWLQFDPDNSRPGLGWFGPLAAVDCSVRWTEASEDGAWTGTLDRVADFDEASRTVTVVVRVNGAEAADRASGLPLVEGMYCRVDIPGTTMTGMIAVPESAVTVDDTVYCANGERLETRTVRVTRRADGLAYIGEGLAPGDRVIATRLVNPLERALLAPMPVQ